MSRPDLIDSTDLDASIESLAQLIGPQPTLRIVIEVPVFSIDFSHCEITPVSDDYEMAGARFTESGYEVDLTQATHNGQPVEFADESEAQAAALNERGIY